MLIANFCPICLENKIYEEVLGNKVRLWCGNCHYRVITWLSSDEAYELWNLGKRILI